MSWLFSQVLVGEYLGDICSDGEQSVQLNGNNTQLAYLQPDKMTDFSRLSRFGMMFKPLTESLGEELLMSYRAAFHAKTLVQQERGGVLKAKEVECGKKWQELLAKLDLNTLLWKTPQCSLLEDSEQSFQTFPKWGSMQNGACWEQIPLVLTTDEKEFGYLPTPTASDQYNGNKIGITYKNKRFIRTSQTTGTEFGAKLTDFYQLTNGRNLHPTFAEWMMNWPLGWTDLKPLETDKYPYVQQPLGTSLKED
jgi:hypothetical protein